MRQHLYHIPKWQFAFLIITLILLGIYIGSVWPKDKPLSFATPSPANNPGASAVNYPQPILGKNVSFADIAEQASKAVVKVTAYYASQNTPEEQFWREFFGWPAPEEKEGESFGTGFFIDPSGYILTNEHVIRNATRLEIKIKGEKNPIPASLVGAIRDLDLALLKVNGSARYPFLKLGDSDRLRVGEWVIAIGNPMGLDHTVTVGVVSAKDRPIATETDDGPHTFRNLIQTDAAINPGNSGGPLLNAAGEVVGINAMVMDVRKTSAVGIGFAIAINTAKNNLATLKAGGDEALFKGHGWLGISLANIDDYYQLLLDLPQELKGVVVTSVVRNGPAAKAGVRPGDVIMGLNNTKIVSIDHFKREIEKYTINNVVQLKIYRGGRVGTLDVRLGRPPEE